MESKRPDRGRHGRGFGKRGFGAHEGGNGMVLVHAPHCLRLGAKLQAVGRVDKIVSRRRGSRGEIALGYPLTSPEFSPGRHVRRQRRRPLCAPREKRGDRKTTCLTAGRSPWPRMWTLIFNKSGATIVLSRASNCEISLSSTICRWSSTMRSVFGHVCPTVSISMTLSAPASLA